MSEITDKHLDLIKTFISEGIKLERARINEALRSRNKESFTIDELILIIEGEQTDD